MQDQKAIKKWLMKFNRLMLAEDSKFQNNPFIVQINKYEVRRLVELKNIKCPELKPSRDFG